MAGVFLLLALTVVMALASFLSGALPLSMSLSHTQLRFISSIGIGILVGTSLIVIIPEGIETISEASLAATHSQHRLRRDLFSNGHHAVVEWAHDDRLGIRQILDDRDEVAEAFNAAPGPVIPGDDTTGTLEDINEATSKTTSHHIASSNEDHEGPVPTFYVGLSLILGFVLMFLIDRLPRHASEKLSSPSPPRHISLSNLGGSGLLASNEESEGFLGSLTPSPKQSRSIATTTGLVIHAASDGIAMGASAATSDMQLGFIVFVAIMVHKAPAAFGLTSVLLEQGLSKRAARGHLIVFSLASPLGAWATFILVNLLGGGGEGGGSWNHWWTGMLLLFSAGTFLYVAMHAMCDNDPPVPYKPGSDVNGYAESSSHSRVQATPQMRDTFATVAGMLLPLLFQFGHQH